MPTHTELQARYRDLERKRAAAIEEIEAIRDANDALADGQVKRAENLARSAQKYASEAATVLDQMRSNVTAAGNGGARLESGDDRSEEPSRLTTSRRRFSDPWTFTGQRYAIGAGESRDRALSAVERSGAPEDGKQKITVALEQAVGDDADRLTRWTLATSSPHYLRAFTKLLRDPENGHREFSEPELDAFQHARAAQRAMSLSDASGGYLVPFQLDPTVMLTSSGVASPMRQLARTVTATGDAWNGVSSAGVSVSFDAEADEVSDDAPTLDQPTVTIRTMRGFVPISIEAYEDEQNVAQTVAELLTDGANALEAETFITGAAASNQPVGLVTALVALGGASVVATAGATLDASDFFTLQQSLPPRFQPNASWLIHLASLNRARSIIAGTGLTTPMLDDSSSPPRLLGKPAHEASTMDDTIAAGNDDVVVYGDMRNAYVIADRVGTTIELIPHLFGANRRPTGQRGFWMHRRVGGNLVNASAARLLNKSA